MSSDSNRPSPISPNLINRNPFRDGGISTAGDLLDGLSPPSYAASQRSGQEPRLRRRANIPPACHESASRRLVIAIDYGTTFTGFASSHASSDHADLAKINVLQEWNRNMSNQSQVPSVISYSGLSECVTQWGSDITDKAVTISRTKLELQPQPVQEELDMLLQVLKGTGNLTFKAIVEADKTSNYTTRAPEEIIADYLSKVFESAQRSLDFNAVQTTRTQVDIVLTVPVGWDYEAHNSMFKAMKKAGFNKAELPTLQDTIMVTEAEAASYFTARDIFEKQSTDFLRISDCFVLCDAGGGTVDLVSFQVQQVQPHLEIEKVTRPSGGRYGSSLIDQKFKEWLRDILGQTQYGKLDAENASTKRISPHTVETGLMREIIAQFNVAKAEFTSRNRADIRLDLRKSLGTLTIDGRVDEGELTIKWSEMQKLMRDCVNGVVKLIKEQIKLIGTEKGRRVRDIILVGGFGASPYLREVLEKTPSLTKGGIGIRRPESALTAVVQGAVIYGIEKRSHPNATCMSAVDKSYGVVYTRDGKKRFEWLLRKGDLVLSNQDTKIESDIFFHDIQNCVNNRCKLAIYMYQSRSDDDDHVPQLWETGSHEVMRVCEVACDFSQLFGSDLRPPPSLIPSGQNRSPSSRTAIGPLRWELKIKSDVVNMAVLLKGSPVGHASVRLETDCVSERNRLGSAGNAAD